MIPPPPASVSSGRRKPPGKPGGIGALKSKARYSNFDLDLNQPLLAAANGGVTGGQQDIWTARPATGTPTNGVRFALDYNNIQVNRVNAPATDISAPTPSLFARPDFPSDQERDHEAPCLPCSPRPAIFVVACRRMPTDVALINVSYDPTRELYQRI